MGDTATVDDAGRPGSVPVRGKPRHLRCPARPFSYLLGEGAAIKNPFSESSRLLAGYVTIRSVVVPCPRRGQCTYCR